MKYWLGTLLWFVLVVAGIWVIDSAVDAVVFKKGLFLENLVPTSGEEVYMRMSILACFLILGGFVAIGNHHREIEQRKTSHLNLVLSSIREVEQSVRRGGEPKDLAAKVCSDLVAKGAYLTAWIALMDHKGRHQMTAQAGLGESFDNVRRNIERGQYTKCMKTAMTQDDVLVIEGKEHSCEGCPLGPIYRGTGSLTMRLKDDGQMMGLLMTSLPADLASEPQEQVLFKEVASDISSALRTAEVEHQRKQAQQELDSARRREAEVGFKIQQMLLFQRPPEDIRGASVGAITVPSQQVDGDFYDFFKHSDHVLDVIVADVMGKGTHAALLGAAAKSQFLRAISTLVTSAGAAHIPQPRDIVTYVHREMTPRLIELESFVTAVYARFDLSQGLLTFVDCGHAKPLLYRSSSGKVEMLQGHNLFLGADPEEVYEQNTVKLEPGDSVLLYSDGIIEVMDKAQEIFGLQKLSSLVQAGGHLTPIKLIDRILMEIIDFAGVDGPSDDLTCVAVQVHQLEASPPLARVELEISSDPAELSRVRGFVLGLSRRLPIAIVDEQDISRLELAVNEATSNIMRHAYHGKADKKIRLEADIYAGRLIIRLYHWGVPYDPSRKLPERTAGQAGGFGLSIIAQCVDEVRYFKAPDGSHFVELTKIITRT